MKQFLKDNWLKIIVAILLLAALGSWQYSYYQALRWVVMIIAGYYAYNYYKTKKNILAIIFGIIAILFNPILPFYLERETWQLFDIAAACAFLYSTL